MKSRPVKFKDLSEGNHFRNNQGQLFYKQNMTGIAVPKHMESWGNASPIFDRVFLDNEELVTFCFYTDQGLQTGDTMTFEEAKVDRICRTESGSLYTKLLKNEQGNAIPFDPKQYIFAEDELVNFVADEDPPELWYFPRC